MGYDRLLQCITGFSWGSLLQCFTGFKRVEEPVQHAEVKVEAGAGRHDPNLWS